jgi:hypothetical protein
METLEIVNKLMKYFKGLSRAYGLYQLKNHTKEGNKILGKPSTIADEVTEELWIKHVKGENGLGIVPIMDGDTCYFGAIDIDIYDLDLVAVVNKIHQYGLPIIPCRSKSGGLHCFCFVSEPVSATLMIQKLKMIASYIGFGDAEIFPKQSTILSDRGDVGAWINMPYFECEKTVRFAIKTNGLPMSIEEFFAAIESFRWNKLQFTNYTLIKVSEIKDGPPCLQNLINIGFIDGHRNDGMFNLAIYLKKTLPSSWEMALDEYNMRYVTPPLTSKEVQDIAKSVRKRDYNYTCNKPPIKNYCNVNLCRTRDFGVGTSLGSVVLTNLTKYDSQPPIWFVDVEDCGRLELSTEDLQSQSKFQRKCMDSLNIMPIPMQPNVWQSVIQDLLKTVTIVEAGLDASPRGLLFEYLEKFCTSRVQARNKDEILLGKPWTENGFHYFRISDFYAFLDRVRFREFKIHQISSILRENGGDHAFIKLKGKGINIWKMPAFEVPTEKFTVPTIEDKELL